MVLTTVCIVYGHTYIARVSIHRVSKVNPARGQPSRETFRENEPFPVRVRAQEFGLARRDGIVCSTFNLLSSLIIVKYSIINKRIM